ncbi:hypothetical protein EKE94_14645 [Mesobaculum littorinae]|uniref:Uncharacterized protein n=1 Tax=Mesobaculum littorinae TaxID=2486419 RepID=A0A438AEX1_9RHOB|nr:hypothetical protein [Mesobaculum littorinae]RVV97251.1 hypothetical protein EKE94_14645 [Mesobaculum littorinae]
MIRAVRSLSLSLAVLVAAAAGLPRAGQALDTAHLMAALDPPEGLTIVDHQDGRFVIQVWPNLVTGASARRVAAGTAQAHCADKGLRPIFTNAERYSKLRLDAWSFAGRCE